MAAVIVTLDGLETLRDTGQGSCAERLQCRVPVSIKKLAMQACRAIGQPVVTRVLIINVVAGNTADLVFLAGVNKDQNPGPLYLDPVTSPIRAGKGRDQGARRDNYL